jgi:Holliday junction DNA helicase RuvA
MIGLLRGRILAKQPPKLLVDVQGVGYEVDVPMTTFYDLPGVGNEVTLHIHHMVREDAQTLYGFIRLSDRDLFRNLLRVNGVGGKLALAILSGMDATVFIRCVQAGDTASLVRLPGVGKKTAERLVMEMRDRLATMDGAAMADTATSHPAAASGHPVEEAVSALIGLGYKPREASRMVRLVETADLSSEEIIRNALQSTIQ